MRTNKKVPAMDPLKTQPLRCEPFQSPLGEIYLVCMGPDLVSIEFSRPHTRMDAVPDGIKRELDEYFAGRLREFTQPVRLMSGTEFERKVWLALRKIPFGETRSYKWLAEFVGSPRGTRAVGRALSKNPVPIVLPCHRVIEAGGKLGGYTPGEEIKRRLLAMEFYQKDRS